MANTNGQETIEIEDSFMASAFQSFDCKVIPFPKPTGKIAFRISGDIQAAVSRISSDEKVGVATYIRILKNLRSQIFLLKSTAPSNERR